jgi:hypothetical protein
MRGRHFSYAASALVIVCASACSDGESNETSAGGGGTSDGGANTGATGAGANTGGSTTSAGGAGTGGMAPTPECVMLCEQESAGGCASGQCNNVCESLVHGSNVNNCDGELAAYFNCKFGLPDICVDSDCDLVESIIIECAQF